jgi:hypothetical protein
MGDCSGSQVDTPACCSRGDGCCKAESGTNAYREGQISSTNAKGKNIDGAFDELFFLEESIINKGMEEGIEAGKRAGFQDAYSMGYTNGKEIGKEIGFYHGHVIGWKALMEKYPDLFSNRYILFYITPFTSPSLPPPSRLFPFSLHSFIVEA